MGPNYSISTACATSNFCILSAANHIIRGEAVSWPTPLVLIAVAPVMCILFDFTVGRINPKVATSTHYRPS